MKEKKNSIRLSRSDFPLPKSKEKLYKKHGECERHETFNGFFEWPADL